MEKGKEIACQLYSLLFLDQEDNGFPESPHPVDFHLYLTGQN